MPLKPSRKLGAPQFPQLTSKWHACHPWQRVSAPPSPALARLPRQPMHSDDRADWMGSAAHSWIDCARVKPRTCLDQRHAQFAPERTQLVAAERPEQHRSSSALFAAARASRARCSNPSMFRGFRATQSLIPWMNYCALLREFWDFLVRHTCRARFRPQTSVRMTLVLGCDIQSPFKFYDANMSSHPLRSAVMSLHFNERGKRPAPSDGCSRMPSLDKSSR